MKKTYQNQAEWTKCHNTPKNIKLLLEAARRALRLENISQDGLNWLADNAEYIPLGDIELLQAAGIPEFEEEND